MDCYELHVKGGERLKLVKFFKTGRDRAMFRVHFGKLRKSDFESTISSRSLPIFPKRIS